MGQNPVMHSKCDCFFITADVSGFDYGRCDWFDYGRCDWFLITVDVTGF